MRAPVLRELRRRLIDIGGWRTAVLKYVFGTSLAGLAFMATYAPSAVEFPAAELRDILLLGAAVHTVPFVAALVLLRSKVRNAVLALIVLGSLWTAYLVHTDLYLTGSKAVFLLSALAIWGGVFAVFEFMDESRWVRLALPSAASLALAIWVIPHAQPWVAGVDRAAADRFYADQVHEVSFASTPNLYFVTLDGLGPQSLGQEYLDIETTDLIELVNADFRRFPNMFAEARWSRDSLHILASLDRGIYREARERHGPMGHLTGEFPNPLYDILHDNGYETTFGYHSSNFGRTKGPYVDDLLIGETRPICLRVGWPVFRVAFWGYCNLLDRNFRDDWWTASHAELMDQVISIAERDRPQFVFAYLRLPAHTWQPFDYADPRDVRTYRERYIRYSSQAAGLVAELLEALEEKDPGAIVFVFGDHGPRLTDGMEFHEDPEFFVKDSYGVLGGIWPPDACESWFDEAQAKGWLTTLDAVHAILRCLSGGAEVLVEPRATTMRNYDDIPNNDPDRSFADFLYE